MMLSLEMEGYLLVKEYAHRLVLLTIPPGERIEYEGIQPAPEEYEDDLLEGVYTDDSKVDCEFLDGNVEEQTPLKRDMGHL